MPSVTFQLGLTLQKPPVAAAADQLGAAVAALGNTVVLGAPGDGSAGVNAGAAFLVDGDPTSPTFGTVQQTLTAPRPAAGQQFGTAVAVVGNGASSGVLVGAPTDSAAAADAGAAYLFDAATGALRQTFTKPMPATGDRFGAAVAGVGANALVGAPGDSHTAPNANEE